MRGKGRGFRENSVVSGEELRVERSDGLGMLRDLGTMPGILSSYYISYIYIFSLAKLIHAVDFLSLIDICGGFG